MKIESGISPSILLPASAQKKPVVRQEEGAQQAAKAGDAAFSVHLSTVAEQAAAPVQDDDEARRARVAAIRDQLASGSYNISGKDVANKILNALKG
jgi:flagellar biosynthesis anti-sigma factor FlgM